jgi:transcriptional activator of cad operon
VVLIAAGVAVVAGWHYWASSHQAAQGTVAMADRSIAVLPFTDMSEKKDQEYFGDGMAEEIIDLMVKIPGLKRSMRTLPLFALGISARTVLIGEFLASYCPFSPSP